MIDSTERENAPTGFRSASYVAYADGSSLNNPGEGGWAVLLIGPDGARTTLTGSAGLATNNVMELTAAIRALQAIPLGASATIRTDSQYVVKGATEWRAGWKRKGMRTGKGQPVLNADLWLGLWRLHDERPGVTFAWVKGHSTDRDNGTVDGLAREAAEGVRFGLDPHDDGAPIPEETAAFRRVFGDGPAVTPA